MKILKTELDGCFDLLPVIHSDHRGRFVKMFQNSDLKSAGVSCDFRESYYSVSEKGVLRGLHFQTPPAAHSKMIYCTTGVIWDVVLDLRKNSKTYGKCRSVELSADKGNGVYISEGFAHGFLTLSSFATVLYFVTSEYDARCDAGILWNSIDVKWPIASPVISSRDAGFITLSEFDSPF